METRERSFWAWGWADHFPDEEARAALGQVVAALLGLPGLLEAERLPRIEEVRLPAPRVAPPAALAEIARADPSARIYHTNGKSYRDQVRAFRGDFAHAPDFVVTPRTEAEIVQTLEVADRERLTVIPFGGGTSVVGGVEAVVGPRHRGVLSLDLRALDRVLEVDPVSRAARIQAGATGPAIEAQLAGHGFTLRHFPQSFEHSTLGGWIATRAGGHFATLYTHIEDLLESVRMITPAGPFETRRLPASGAGPSPDRLVAGSEGTLGVITEAWLRVRPRPRFRSSASVRFDDFAAAVRATRAIAQSGLHPANCRLLDAREAALHGVSDDGSSVLLLGFESDDHPQQAWLERALALAIGEGGRVPEPARHRVDTGAGGRTEDEGAWRSAFLEGPYLQSALISLGVVADTFETACTWDKFDALHEAVVRMTRDAMKRVAGGGRIALRFSHVYPDGPAPYYTFLCPARRGAEIEQWAEIKRAASDALINHGATITHHHAVGRTHREGYDRERPDLYAAVLRAAKRTLDPSGLLNPGVLIDPE